MNGACMELIGVGFSYVPQRAVLRGVNFRIGATERVTLLGANGSGKTTLLHLLVGLLRPTEGRIEAFGRPRATEDDFREVRTRAGMLFQDPDDQLFCPTVLEDVAFGPLNLGMAPPDSQAVAEETLAALGLAGYEDRITYRLSMGEKHLVALAAVLAMKPEILLLDEPGASLDGRARRRLTEILLRRGEGMLMVSHDLSMAVDLCERAVLLDEGRIVADGPAREILADSALLTAHGVK